MTRTYPTAEEYRAFVEGTSDTVHLLLNVLMSRWRAGDDTIELETLRGWLLSRLSDMAAYTSAAQRFEAAK